MPATVEQSMKLMERSLKQLSKQVADPAKKEENLKLIGAMERGCLGAKGVDAKIIRERETSGGSGLEIKPMPAPLAPGGKGPDTVDMYRRHLIGVMQKLLALEAAVLDNKADEAKAAIASLTKLRDEGHKALGVGED